MREVGASEAGESLSTLLDDVERGEEVVITRGGKPVAKLVALRPAAERPAAVAIVDRILTRRAGRTLGGISIKSLIDEGRR